MLKRLTWASVGLVTGLGASKWLEHQARKRLRRYLRDHPGPRYAVAAGGELRVAASEARSALVHATEEGRRAMEAREQQLRAQLGLPGASRPAIGSPSQEAAQEAATQTRLRPERFA